MASASVCNLELRGWGDKKMSYLIASIAEITSSVIRYLELKLHNFTSSCNTLNTGSVIVLVLNGCTTKPAH
jgi:hypothetical protein